MKNQLILSIIISTLVFYFVNINVGANPHGRNIKFRNISKPPSKPPKDDCDEPLAPPSKTPGSKSKHAYKLIVWLNLKLQSKSKFLKSVTKVVTKNTEDLELTQVNMSFGIQCFDPGLGLVHNPTIRSNFFSKQNLHSDFDMIVITLSSIRITTAKCSEWRTFELSAQENWYPFLWCKNSFKLLLRMLVHCISV